MNHRILAVAATALSGLALGAVAASAATTPELTASLAGQNEVGAHDGTLAGYTNPSGSFTAHREGNRLCYAITLDGVDRTAGVPVRAYLLRGTSKANAKSNGIRLTHVSASGTATGCQPVLGSRLDAIVAHPSGYYIDVFTSAPKADWSGGTIRGQLHGSR